MASFGLFSTVLVITVLLLLLLSGVAVYVQPHFIVRHLQTSNPDVLFYVNTKEKVVALSIDDAPTRVETSDILDILKDHGVQATFFCIGFNINNEDPQRDLLLRMRREGHEIANHMYIDEPSYRLPYDEFERQIINVDRLISLDGYLNSSDLLASNISENKWFRPGHGFFTKKMVSLAAAHGYKTALGNVFPHDPSIPWPAVNSYYVAKRVHPGSIIVLHNRPWTKDTLNKVLPELKEKGYRVTTISELLKYDLTVSKSK